MTARRRRTEALEGGLRCHIDGPDDDYADRFDPEKPWQGQFYIFRPYDADRRVYTPSDAPPGEDGVPVVQWNRVTDAATLERVR